MATEGIKGFTACLVDMHGVFAVYTLAVDYHDVCRFHRSFLEIYSFGAKFT